MWWNKKLVGIRVIECLVLVGFYIILAFSYHATLVINSKSWDPEPDSIFSFSSFMDLAGLDYLIKLIITIPFWWLLFRKFKHVNLEYRLSFHIIGLPVFVLLFVNIYYASSEFFGFSHLEGYGVVWDYYIPSLFYILQFGIFHAYQYYQDNQRSLKRRAELKEAALKSELSALKAQLNPHFLYNIFNTISASLPPEQESTREMIAKLSDLFRYQLKGSKSELVLLSEEVEFVETYLELEQARFQDRLKFSLEIDDAAKFRKIPPMIIQPLVENAVKHGIATKIEGGKIDIKIAAETDFTTFDIKDNGMGMGDKIIGSGVGLENTRMRLLKMYDEKLEFLDTNREGVHVHFKIPFSA